MLHLPAAGLAPQINEHADAHAVHEGHFRHVNMHDAGINRIAKCLAHGFRDDFGFTLPNVWSDESSNQNVAIQFEIDEQGRA